MERLFGIPLDTLATALVAVMALLFGVIAVLAVRNRVFLRMAGRNVARRRARSALIVAGLMLATAIISASLATGDTMGRTVRSAVLESLGEVDEAVVPAGTDLDPSLALDAGTRAAYFDPADAAGARRALEASPLVDGVAPVVMQPIAVQDRSSRRSEPQVMLFGADGADRDALGDVTSTSEDGGAVSLDDLGTGEAYLNADAADELGARAGDQLIALGGAGPVELTVRDVIHARGTGTADAAVLVPLGTAQQVVGQEGRISHLLVSNAGGEASGVALTDDVTRLAAPALDGTGLELRPMKRTGLEQADEQGDAFLSLFSTFGSFSIVAGVLLVFLIFVMLAAERRTEMGIARAVGTQRGHLVQSFVFEGALYDLAAAAIGAVLGLGVAYVMVEAVISAFATDGITIEHAVRPGSILVAWGLGVVLTLGVVTVSAWRVSRLDVVTAIRNLPPVARPRRRRAQGARGAALVVVGVLLTVAGLAGSHATPFLLGASLVVAGLVPVAQALGAGDRLAHTVGGVLIVTWWLLPFGFYDRLAGQLTWDFSVWIVAGLMVVLGATWTIMHNADALLAAAARTIGRVRSLAPVVRMAVAYPLRNRLQTSMTLAMFTLVVLTLVTGATISGSFVRAFDDLDTYSGGFDVRAVSSPVAPLGDVDAALAADGLDSQVAAVGAQSAVPAEARQAGTAAFADYVLRGVDDGFLDATTYDLAAVANGYGTSAAVWEALADQPGLAVVDPFVAPRRNAFTVGALPDFQLHGFFVEDGTFAPVEVEVRDPATGAVSTLTVIGVLGDNMPWEMGGITTSQASLAAFGDRATPTTHWFALRDGAAPDAVAAALESTFLDNGVDARTLTEMLDEAVSASWTMNRLVQGFIGLGLVVGVVAMGVVSARAVVERRQHIGVLRAIGFQARMVRLAFLMEASFVSLTAIVLGCGLGLVVAANVVGYIGEQQDVTLAVPWLNLAVIFTIVYAASLLSTLLPAVRASKVYPAEALRYQ